jgi:hypothetical protein
MGSIFSKIFRGFFLTLALLAGDEELLAVPSFPGKRRQFVCRDLNAAIEVRRQKLCQSDSAAEPATKQES